MNDDTRSQTAALHLQSRQHSFAPDTLDGPHAWMDQMACKDADPELFFPTTVSEKATRPGEVRMQYCGRCPVTAECDQFAGTAAEGIFGGRSASARRRKRGAA